MKTISKAIALLLSMWMVLAYPVGVSAVERDDPTTYATIQEDRKGSLTIYKYDLTSAERDGIWDNSYVSTGIYDEEGVNNILGGTNRVGDNDNQADLGNGDVSYGYAIKGVEFTYVKVLRPIALFSRYICNIIEKIWHVRSPITSRYNHILL